MTTSRDDLAKAVRGAVRHFWRTRARQARAQGAKSGDRDRGARSAVTGGAHLDGFAALIQELIVDAGVSDTAVHRRTRVELPGYYRAEKKWDLVVVVDGRLFATVEFKAQVGPSFGNNYNNRLTKMVRERLYDAASLIPSPSDAGQNGAFSEPCSELTFANFAESLVARAIAYSRTQK